MDAIDQLHLKTMQLNALLAWGRKIMEAVDQLHLKAMQLSALLAMITGEGRERLLCMDEKSQAYYLLTCSFMADDVADLADKLTFPHETSKGEES